MSDGHISRGFTGAGARRAIPAASPSGRYLTRDIPVLSGGPTPHTPLDQSTFTVDGGVDAARSWTWEEFLAPPDEMPTVDIHSVTEWSKHGISWRGVSVDTLLEDVETEVEYVTPWCDGGYTTNLALEDVTDGKAWSSTSTKASLSTPEHSGLARRLVPHLYSWKSAKRCAGSC